jgi:hypothetical protein
VLIVKRNNCLTVKDLTSCRPIANCRFNCHIATVRDRNFQCRCRRFARNNADVTEPCVHLSVVRQMQVHVTPQKKIVVPRLITMIATGIVVTVTIPLLHFNVVQEEVYALSSSTVEVKISRNNEDFFSRCILGFSYSLFC